MFFIAQNVFSLGQCSVRASGECVRCCGWMKQSRDVSDIKLIDGVVEFNYVSIDFLPAGSVHF